MNPRAGSYTRRAQAQAQHRTDTARARNSALAGGGDPAAAAEAEARARAEAAARANRQRNQARQGEHAAGNGPGAGGGGNPNPGPSLGGDPGLLSAEDARQRDRGLADAQYGYTLGQLGSTYGFDQYGGIDVNNPMSRAALLQDSYRRSVRANRGSYAASGQLYSGALQNAQDESGRDFNIGLDQLAKGYQAQVGQAMLDRRSAYGSADDRVTAALLAALATATGGNS